MAIVTERWDGMWWTRRHRARDGIAGRDKLRERSHGRAGRTMPKRTAKSCGPDASMVGVKSVEGKSARPGADEPTIRRRRGHESPIPRGERDISRKAIAQGMSDVLRCPVCSCAHSLHNFAHETAGAARILHSLLPLWREATTGKPRANHAARRRTCIRYLKMNRISLSVIASAAKQSIYQPARCQMDCFAALAMTVMEFWRHRRARHNAPQRRFSHLSKSRDGRTIPLPTQSRAELQPRRRRWDKT